MAECGSDKMILRIIILFFFIVFLSFLLFFIYGIFIPAVKPQITGNRDLLFSDAELNCSCSFAEDSVGTSSNQAVVLCSAERSFETEWKNYNGIKSCALYASIYETAGDCKFGCIGFGDCAAVCPQEAVVIQNGTAVITDNCCGCGKCIPVCPKHIIRLFDKNAGFDSVRQCSAPEHSLTTCSVCKNAPAGKCTVSEQKDFKFWKSCYRIVTDLFN